MNQIHANVTREQAFDLMLQEPPKDWWRFVPCGVCNSARGEVCRKGGWSWPEPARRPHQSRYDEGLRLHGVVWLLENGFAGDVLGDLIPAPDVVWVAETRICPVCSGEEPPPPPARPAPLPDPVVPTNG